MLRKKNACKEQASVNTYHYKDLLEQDNTARQFEDSSDQTSKAKTATESDYSYAAVQGISKQLEQVGANEATYAEIKETEPQPYELATDSIEALPNPTDADNDHMYAVVTKEGEMSNTTSEEMSKVAQAAQISVPPANTAPYNCEICL